MPNPTNNEEWREEFNKLWNSTPATEGGFSDTDYLCCDCGNEMGYITYDEERIKRFIDSQIQAAKKQGKRDGLEIGRQLLKN